MFNVNDLSSEHNKKHIHWKSEIIFITLLYIQLFWMFYVLLPTLPTYWAWSGIWASGLERLDGRGLYAGLLPTAPFLGGEPSRSTLHYSSAAANKRH